MVCFIFTTHNMSTGNNIFSQWPPTDKQQWLEQVRKDLKGADFNKTLVSEYGGIRVEPVYTQSDIPESEPFEDSDFEEMLDFEDEDTHAITWSICRELTFAADTDIYTLGDPERNNGAMCMRISGDIPLFLRQFRLVRPDANHFTLHIDSDLAEHEIVVQYRDLINNIGGHQIYITAIEFDPIGYWLKKGVVQNREASFNNLAELYVKLSPRLHDCKLFHIDCSILAEAGAGIIQQLAYGLSIAAEYISGLAKRNVPVEEIFQLMHFRVSVGSEYFFEIAKLRALRRLWINLLKAYIPDMDYVFPAYIHAVVTQTNIAAEDPHTNILRATTEAMSAVLGGCETLSILPYDLHCQPKDPNAGRLALNIQHILRYESNLDACRDMAEGAYYIEALTTAIAESAWEYFTEIQGKGGFIALMHAGKIQEDIRTNREKTEADFAEGSLKLIGVNAFINTAAPIQRDEAPVAPGNPVSFEPLTPFYFKGNDEAHVS